MQTTTQQVRQVLVNELGLSREFVREEARRFVEPIVAAEVQRLIDNGGIKEMVMNEMSRLSNKKDAPLGVNVSWMVQREAERAAKEWVTKHIQIRDAANEP